MVGAIARNSGTSASAHKHLLEVRFTTCCFRLLFALDLLLLVELALEEEEVVACERTVEEADEEADGANARGERRPSSAIYSRSPSSPACAKQSQAVSAARSSKHKPNLRTRNAACVSLHVRSPPGELADVLWCVYSRARPARALVPHAHRHVSTVPSLGHTVFPADTHTN